MDSMVWGAMLYYDEEYIMEEKNTSGRRKSAVIFMHSIRFKLILTVILGGIVLMTSMLWLITNSITKVEQNLMDSRLSADIEYLRDELGENEGRAWAERDGSLYIGDTLIGDGTLENANEDVFFHCEKITGTFYYTFVRTYDEDELTYVEEGDYQQGHYKRVAGTTKGPKGENIEGTYIDKEVADVLESSFENTGEGVYSGKANVNGRMIYCRYELLLGESGEIVGIIVVGRSIEEMEELQSIERFNGVSSVVVVLMLICFAISVTIGFMVAAVEKIKARLDLVGVGVLPDEPLQLRTKDELADIVVSINAMVESLKEKERIGAELDVASKIQVSILPCIFPAFPERAEFDIFATMQPAKEVGGDFYDFLLVDEDHLALVMADVSGKGVPAALFMAISKILLKNSIQTGIGPSEVLSVVNHQLCENNDEDMFVTAWIGILEISTGRMLCSNAGHEHPALRRANGEYELVEDKHGFVLGGMDMMRYPEYELKLEPGDEIYVYTDGVTEAMNIDNELFGTKRMLEALNANKGSSSREILATVKQFIDGFAGEAPQFDDITMMSVRYFGPKN